MWICKSCGHEVVLTTRRIDETKYRIDKDLTPQIIIDSNFLEDEVESKCSKCGKRSDNIEDIAEWREE